VRSRSICAAAILAGALFTGAAHADVPDQVYLRSGGSYSGRITELVPNDHVTILTLDGESKRIAWTDIDRVVASDAPPMSITPKPEPLQPDSTTPPGERPPEMKWRANQPLLIGGAIMFGAGYAPNFVLGVPSGLGLVGRVIILVFTVGLPCLFNNNHDYLCEGQHGAVQLLLPFAGPFLFANDHPRDTLINEKGRELDGAPKVLLYTSGVLQIVGMTGILMGHALGKDQPVERPDDKKADVKVLPLVSPGAVGLTLNVSRW